MVETSPQSLGIKYLKYFTLEFDTHCNKMYSFNAKSLWIKVSAHINAIEVMVNKFDKKGFIFCNIMNCYLCNNPHYMNNCLLFLRFTVSYCNIPELHSSLSLRANCLIVVLNCMFCSWHWCRPCLQSHSVFCSSSTSGFSPATKLLLVKPAFHIFTYIIRGFVRVITSHRLSVRVVVSSLFCGWTSKWGVWRGRPGKRLPGVWKEQESLALSSIQQVSVTQYSLFWLDAWHP